jgi:hypothetical protein
MIKKLFGTVLISMILSASVLCYAGDNSNNPYYVAPNPPADLPSRLGVPSQPTSYGENYTPTAMGSIGLSSCGDLGMTSQYAAIVQMITSILQNPAVIEEAMAMGVVAYAMPTEYSIVSNIGSMAIKYLEILSNRCRVFQETQKFLERKDVAGIQSAAVAACMQKNNGDQIACSNHATAWAALWGDTNCHSLMHEALQNVSNWPSGTSEQLVTNWFGDINLCPNGSQPKAPTANNITNTYTSLQNYYTTAVNTIVSTAQSRAITDTDVQGSGICVGAASSTGGSTGSAGIICPSSAIIQKIAAMPPAYQSVFKPKLVSILTILEIDYWNNQATYLVKYANQQINMHKGIDPNTLPSLASAKGMEWANYKDSLILAHGQSASLDNFEKQVLTEDTKLRTDMASSQSQQDFNNATSINNQTPSQQLTTLSSMVNHYKTNPDPGGF